MFKLLLLPVLAISLSSVAFFGAEKEPVVQPLAFNHKLHMEEDVTCVECHLHAEDGAIATLPPTRVCMLCHEEPQGEEPEEPRVREYAELDKFIPWIIVNESVDHVYFSHEAHVTWAAMECSECHGDTAALTEPVTMSQVEHLDMDACMDCHTERGASNDCIICHQ